MKEYRCAKCNKLLFTYKTNADLDGVFQFDKIDGIPVLTLENKCPKCGHANKIEAKAIYYLD